MIKSRSLSLLIGLLLLFSGCDQISPLQATPFDISPTPTPIVVSPSPSIQQTPASPITLRIWLPPEFSPNENTSQGRLIKTRLDEFSSRRAGVRLEVRIKAQDGSGGLLDTLTTASAAAHQILPDLIALPRPSLEAAAIKGLLQPMDGLTTVMDDTDWYEYARQLARVQNSVFGLPFAGDALILVYRPTAISVPPKNIDFALEYIGTIAFPASDPKALFPLALYLSGGGEIQDEQGRPILIESNLKEVLTLFKEAENRETMPYWLTQYQTYDEVWQVFLEKRADMVVVWASTYLQELIADHSASSIPTIGGNPYTLASGWVWASASQNSERLELSIQLAEFLSSSDFLKTWSSEIGFIPPRPSALVSWQDTSLHTIMNQIALSANLYPPADVLSIISPPLSMATMQIFKQQSDPSTAANEAIANLAHP